ncbi:MAG: carbohydrate-binding family 9-like protein [Kiritimatiellae bacterium]|nr:carbohydrate-binding family 9-like protein [Kiritimatiellia bacterium]
MKLAQCLLCVLSVCLICGETRGSENSDIKPVLTITKVDDFEITGNGSSSVWEKTNWQSLARIWEGKSTYPTKVKVLYSNTGIYFLFDCEDKQLTCTMTKDFDDIFKEDVVEVFLWPDEKQDLYFEYEASPLEVQLPILVPNHNGKFFGWRPWRFEGDRLTKVKTSVRGGKKKKMAKVTGWTAEFFIPFKLMTGMDNVPPASGTKWRANIYRIDYDNLPQSHWVWSTVTKQTFHDFHNFGVFKFE